MRRRRQHAGLTVNVIAGTYVVFFGLNLAKSKRAGFRGFAFKRFDQVEGDTIWLQGLKTFEKTEPHPAIGERFSTLQHPVQSFQWADYSAKPGRAYTYTVVALYGDPASLEQRITLEFDITTEAEAGAVHSAFFNRGSVATQEYARRFQNEPPSTAGPGAYEWLSRGLLEALVAFLGRAGAGWDVHGAVYEFQRPEALAAVRQAHLRGAKVRVLYDDVESFDKDGKPKGPFQRNRDAIDAANIKGLCQGRTHGKLMHNKFFVLSQNGQPKAVWTGSTNLTENGIYGHSNVGHIVEDAGDRAAVPRLLGPARGRPHRRQGLPSSERRCDSGASEPLERRHDRGLLATRNRPLGAAVVRRHRRRRKTRPVHDLRLRHAREVQDVYRHDDSILRMALMEKDWATPERSPKTNARSS